MRRLVTLAGVLRVAGVVVATLTVVTLAGCDGGGGGGGGSKEAFCGTVEVLRERGESLENFDITDPGSLDRVQEALGDLEDSAPAEVADDVETLRDAFERLTELDLDNIEEFDPEELAEQSERLTEAAGNVDAYVRDECGIDAEG